MSKTETNQLTDEEIFGFIGETHPIVAQIEEDMKAANAAGYAEPEGVDPTYVMDKFLPTESSFPLDIYPAWLQAYLTETAKVNRAPVGLAGMTAIGLISAAAGPSWRVKGLTDHTRGSTAALYVLCSAKTSAGKGELFDTLGGSLEQFFSEFRATYTQHRLPEIKTQRVIANKVIKSGKDMDGMTMQQAVMVLDQMSGITPIYHTGNTTPEALNKYLGLNDLGYMFIISSEGADQIAVIRGRYDSTSGNQFNSFCNLWSGKQDNTLRITRENSVCEKPYVPMLLATQPETLKSLLLSPEATTSGFLPRILFADFAENRAARTGRVAISPKAGERWNIRIESLLRKTWGNKDQRIADYAAMAAEAILNDFGVPLDEREGGATTITATDAAYEVLMAYDNRITKDADAVDIIGNVAGKVIENTTRVALCLALIHYDRSADAEVQVTADIVEKAIRLVEWSRGRVLHALQGSHVEETRALMKELYVKLNDTPYKAASMRMVQRKFSINEEQVMRILSEFPHVFAWEAEGRLNPKSSMGAKCKGIIRIPVEVEK